MPLNEPPLFPSDLKEETTNQDTFSHEIQAHT
jgi:hypothetical protein